MCLIYLFHREELPSTSKSASQINNNLSQPSLLLPFSYFPSQLHKMVPTSDVSSLIIPEIHLQFSNNIIDELVKNGKEVEAVYFASESGLTERFPPINLLKSYLRNFRKNATTSSKSGNNSQAAMDESSSLELNSIKAAIKDIEDHKLESEFNLDSLRKKVAHLEKSKAERKKSSGAESKSHKRSYGSSSTRGAGLSSFRTAKASKFNSYPSLNWRNPAPPQPGSV